MLNPKKFQINGFRFLQYSKNVLVSHVNTPEAVGFEKPLDASAVAVYIAFMSEAQLTAGIIDADLTLNNIAKKLNISPSTVNNGYHTLIHRGLLSERLIGNKTQIEIVGYAENNLSAEETRNKTGLNYFIVSYEIFNTPVVAQLVHARSPRGLILMLDLFNSFHRDFKHAKESIAEYKDELLMSTLKQKLKLPSSFRVRKIVDILSPLFRFSPVGLKERKPRERSSRVRKAATQIFIRKYIIHINPSCIIDKKMDVDTDTLKTLDDALYRIKYMNIPMYSKERNGLFKAFRSIVVEIADHLGNKKARKKLINETMQVALENLEAFVQTSKLESVGRFLNKQFQNHVLSFLDQEKGSGLTLDIATFYDNTQIEPPFIWKKFVEAKSTK